MDWVPAAAQADRSSPKVRRSCPRCEIAPKPTVGSRARRPASHDPTGRSRGYLPKQSSPYIRRVQHTVLSVAGLKGTLSEAELFTLRTRLYEGRWNKARKGLLQFPLPTGFVRGAEGGWEL